jgi:hypothetical protein
MITKRLFLSFFLLATATLYAQENLVKGYLVKASHDTVRGFISFSKSGRNPDNVFFTEQQGTAQKEFKPFQIAGFGTEETAFVSTVVEAFANFTDEDLSQPKTRKDTTFLKRVVGDGNHDLYYYKDRFGTENFYIRQNNLFELLIYKKYSSVGEYATSILENKKFLGQLALYFRDCPGYEKKLRRVRYNTADLQEFFNSCLPKRSQKITIARNEVGFLFGPAITFMKFHEQPYAYLSLPNLPPSLSGAIGFYVKTRLPKQGWSINSELLFTGFNFQGWANSSTISLFSMYRFTSTYLKLNGLLRHELKGNAHPFLNFGLGLDQAMYHANHAYVLVAANGAVNNAYLAVPDAKNTSAGLLFGVGLTPKKMSYELRYEAALVSPFYNQVYLIAKFK